MKFKSLLDSQGVKAGDELVIDHMYRIRGTYKLPDGFTLSTKKDAGFEVSDAKSNGRPFLELGNRTTLNNLTITYLNTPELGGRSYKHAVDFFDKCGISASGRSGVLIKNCRLEGMISHHIGLSNCVQPRVIGCHVIGGFWAVTISGKDLLFKDCLFEKQGGYGVDYPKQGEHMRVILLKDAYNIRYKNARLVGDRIMPVLVHTIGGSSALSKEAADAIDRKATGNILDKPATPPKPGDATVSFACGPQVLD